MDTFTPVTSRPRTVALVVLGCLAAGSATGLTGALVSCAPQQPAETARSLSAMEAQRLAAMRVTNYQDGQAGLRATLGLPGAENEFTGWVDWSRSLVYLAVDGPGPIAPRGLLQAVPGLLATRPTPALPAIAATAAAQPSPESAGAPPAEPPTTPPSDGWRVRRLAPDGPAPTPLDSFLALLFTIAADRPDPAEPLERSEARWLGRDRTGGTMVDVLLGPAVPAPPTEAPGRTTSAPTSLAAMGGAVRYWLDSRARLHRFEALLPGDVPVRVDLDRTAQPKLTAIAALGGRPVRPRAVTAQEARLLAGIGRSSRAHGGATVSLAVPTLPTADLPNAELPAANLRGAGWINWYRGSAYLSIRDLEQPAEELLVRAGQNGVAVRRVSAPPPGTGTPGPAGGASRDSSGTASPDPLRGPLPPLPPLPPPSERRWAYTDWQRRGDTHGGLDLDLLVNEALAVGGGRPFGLEELRATAGWLRTDTVGDRKVTVFEIPKPAEADVPRGQARLRYWVDQAGVLRRLELRTRTGAFAQLDVDPGPVPYLPAVPIG